MPKVSVLMPVYKTDEKQLRGAIQSILNQSFTKFEFLILDDCPEDSRESIVKSFHDKRIHYIKNERNMGISGSRNKLIDMAKGQYLAIFDHDDISLPYRLKMQVAYLDAHPDVGVVSGIMQRMFSNKQFKYPTDDSDIKLYLMRGSAIPHTAAMIRKEVLIKNDIRYKDEFTPAEDYALWCQLIPITKFHNLSDVLVYYRDHSENTSHRQKEKMDLAAQAVRAFVRTENPKLYNLFLQRARRTIKLKLFGVIPFLRIDMRGDVIKCKLFGFIPFLSGKINARF